MSDAPPFWYRKQGLISVLLAPIGWIYGAVSASRMTRKSDYISTLPVLCVGNFVSGGAGKTPTVIALVKLCREMGLRPGILSRGYGGAVKTATPVDPNVHNARDVGDEPLVLAAYAATVVSPDRGAGARLLEEEGVDIIIMDDGFQNPSLHKDASLVVVDAKRGVGNGFCIPAGPLRASLTKQMAKMSALLLIGDGKEGASLVRRAARMARPVLQARTIAQPVAGHTGGPVIAYCGIADPDKFYRSLEEVGVEVEHRRSFGDHHMFSPQDCADLMSQSGETGLSLITTEKDAARLRNMGGEAEALLSMSRTLHIELEFENAIAVRQFVEKTISNAKEFRLKNRPTRLVELSATA